MSRDKKRKKNWDVEFSSLCVLRMYPGGNLTQEVGFDTHTELYVVLENFSGFGQLHILKCLPVHLQYLHMGIKKTKQNKKKRC